MHMYVLSEFVKCNQTAILTIGQGLLISVAAKLEHLHKQWTVSLTGLHPVHKELCSYCPLFLFSMYPLYFLCTKERQYKEGKLFCHSPDESKRKQN